ncbi:small heat shock protein [Candidatus Scalindua japonica]|uniref:Small heat shock protein n=1 Tax=Candidatus Scalindua japonica TaxID=1284222 RepID=A0A286U127_9BACT|nr:Hsp20/alpha crystallin family protein [Candidatus Scalindua japonica]GAX61828.1 small heat shock protein [Candidatus Scalindua japonica]
MKRELIRLNRLPLFDAFNDDMSKLFDNFWNTKSPGGGWNPDIDIAETDNDIIVNAEIPGVDPKNIDISIVNDMLIIKGEKKEEKEEKEKSYHRVERTYGSFTRTIELPAQVNKEKVEAKEHQGVLKIILPKMEKSETKKIAVKSA